MGILLNLYKELEEPLMVRDSAGSLEQKWTATFRAEVREESSLHRITVSPEDSAPEEANSSSVRYTFPDGSVAWAASTTNSRPGSGGRHRYGTQKSPPAENGATAMEE